MTPKPFMKKPLKNLYSFQSLRRAPARRNAAHGAYAQLVTAEIFLSI